MDVRVGLLFLFVIGASWVCCARELGVSDLFVKEAEVSDVSVLQLNLQDSETEAVAAEKVDRNEEICMLCEEYVAEAVDYLADNKTQVEILDILHKSCSKLFSFKKQCITLVDYYAPLLFLEISTIQADNFCTKFNLCGERVSTSQSLLKDTCGICHEAVAEALLKLKDPDTQLDIIEVLLKACNAVKGQAQKCKRLVFEYGPVLLVNAEQFLEKVDVCTIFRACKPNKDSNKEALPVAETSKLFSS